MIDIDVLKTSRNNKSGCNSVNWISLSGEMELSQILLINFTKIETHVKNRKIIIW